MAHHHIISKKSWVAAALAVFAAAIFAAPASSAPSADPQCGDVLTSDVVLTSNLVCSGDALTIAGFAEVTLDLHGHSISGSGVGTGITISPSLNEDLSQSTPGHVTVKNGSVRGFQTGIAVVPSFIHGDDSVQLDQLSIRANGTGFSGFLGGVETTLADSTIARNLGNGVAVSHFLGFRMINDQVRENGGNGIFAGDQDGLRLLQDSFIAHNGGAGARLESTFATVSGNTFLGNGGTGLSIEESTCFVLGYLVSNNVADQNGGGGMSMAGRSCILPGPPPGGGNAAENNAIFQCVVIVCGKNPGQTK